MVMYMFTVEHAENTENTESPDRCEVLGSRIFAYSHLTTHNSHLQRHLSTLCDLGGKR